MLVEASITKYPKAAAGHVLVDWLFCAYNSAVYSDCVCSNVRIILSIIYDEMDVMSFLFCITLEVFLFFLISSLRPSGSILWLNLW